MRFVFVDRLVALDPGRTIEILKNVSATEDVFEDHFPGHPILPGALIVETFEQTSQLLIGVSHDFTRVGRLSAVRRVAFRHFVRPGDQLRVRCAGASAPGSSWTITASADVDGRRVASAFLDFELVVADGPDKTHADRLRDTVAILRATPIDPGGGLA